MRSYSQPATQQDVWVIKRLEGRRNGYFVEIGAHNGVHHSNTKMLEDHFGWTGILVEPNPELFKELDANRPNTCRTNVVVGPKDDDYVTFRYGNSYGGIELFMPDDWLKEHDRRRTPRVFRFTQSLKSLLDGFAAPQWIDYLSLDVEGAELPILREFFKDRGSYEFGIITVEFRYDRVLLAKLEELLAPQYTLEHVQAFDAFFVNKRLVSCSSLLAA